MNADLASWNDTAARKAIQEFVAKVINRDNSAYVPSEERIAILVGIALVLFFFAKQEKERELLQAYRADDRQQ